MAPPVMAPPGDPARRPARANARWRFATLIAGIVVLGGVVVALGSRSTSPSVEPNGSPGPEVTFSGAPSGASGGSSGPAVGKTPGPTPSGAGSTLGPPFLAREELARRAALARQGIEPYASAVEGVLRDADRALDRDPAPVEPLVIKGQFGSFSRDASRAYGLGLAYALSGEEQYARAAARFLVAWARENRSAEDVCPDSGGCHTSLILGRNAPGFVFAAELIDGSPAFGGPDVDRVKEWLRTVILPSASERPNNWGDAGTFTRAAITDYLGDEAGFAEAIDAWRTVFDRVTAEGQIPEETRRGRDGLQYSQEALQYKIAVAEIAAGHGIDLWSHQGRSGASLRTAVDLVARYMDDPDAWPWDDRVRVPSPGPFWEIVYARWRDPDHARFVEAVRPYGDRGHSALRWTTVTHGLPIEPGTPSP